MLYCCWMLWSMCMLLVVKSTFALTVDEVGVTDFLVATAGHGPTRFVHVVSSASGDGVITSDSPAKSYSLQTSPAVTSCFVSRRSVETGSLQWRRNVCSSSSTTSGTTSHVVAAAGDSLWTMDSHGIVRAWDAQHGRLKWDAQLPAIDNAIDQPRLLLVTSNTNTKEEPFGIAAVAKDLLFLLDARTGEALGSQPLSASQVLAQHKMGTGSQGQEAQWLQIMVDEKEKWQILVGWISTSTDEGIATAALSDLLLVDVTWQPDQETLAVTKGERLSHNNNNNNMDVSSLVVLPQGVGIALTADQTKVMTFGIPRGHVETFVLDSPINALAAITDSLTKFNIPTLVSWTKSLAVATCSNTNVAVTTLSSQDSSNNLQVWKSTDNHWNELTVTLQSPHDNQASTYTNALQEPQITSLTCTDDHVTLLLSTPFGSTAVVQIDLSSSGDLVWKWTAEEGLASIASGLLMDASHALVLDDLAVVVDGTLEQEPVEIAQRLALSARLASQWENVVSRVRKLQSLSASSFASSTTTGSSAVSAKDKLFGFVQIAVLVSERTHRLYGMELTGPQRGTASWTLDLPTSATWHKLVHGTHNAAKAKHGIHGGTHTKEVLVLSALSDSTSVDWKCVDGTNGEIHVQGLLEISSPVVQVMPLVGGGVCRQQAILLHQDHSISIVPPATEESSIHHALTASANGLFAHVIANAQSHDNDGVHLESYQITAPNAPVRLVGRTTFPGERLIQTVYPPRDEVVESPCMILGDDSLLLKYLNPHLAAIISVRDDTSADRDELAAALRRSRNQAEKKKKKKPLGVTPKTAVGAKGEPTTAAAATVAEDDAAAIVQEDEPNFFVSIVDTVSGRVLYRTSHANVATSPRHIRAVISENWIVYSFVNAKTRKAEVGVLSLYEGMIHRKGLTAFTSPEQTTEFSSWDARETKPIVLSKTYSLPKPVTALGVTETRNGISAHQILLATTEDRVYSVGRAVLEPRRPLSDLKEAEKLEGLRQYSELIPLLSLQALSYNLTVHAPTQIVSAPTELESQTLVFAFGGPDLFFTRTSPSKGFDMLPESFNRILLSLLTVALVAVVVVTKRMAKQKIVKHGWI